MSGVVHSASEFLSPQAQRFISITVVAGCFGLLLVAETVASLRSTVESKLRRVIRNLTTGGVSLAILTLLQTPVLIPASRWAAVHHVGLMNWVQWPSAVEIVITVVLFDYTLWFWHRANHTVPFLWRFHLVHHVDLDLDASTALRFHFGELVLSIAYRVAQIIVIGASSFSVWVWQTILFASILFHHSNLRLPIGLERLLTRLIVTPRMHGIHHSTCLNETNSNWASLFSCWDYLHRTILLDVPQSDVTIGVPAYRDPRDVTIGKILLLPFRRQRADWLLPNGKLATRPHPGPHEELAD
jgi:sterol desaturase/sphingolipid hydroxylase (fatty acid hydroxylase superfamily)